MSEIKLLPCPFCGGKPFVYTTGNVSCGYYVEIICENCGCRTDRAIEKVALKVWNERKPMERIVNRIEEFAECKSCEEVGLSESFYYGQGCKACMWKKIIEIVRAGGKE